MNIEDKGLDLEAKKGGILRLANGFLLIGSLLFIVVVSFILNMTINFFDSVSVDKKEWAARKELVASGKIKPLDATVMGKRYEKETITKGVRLEDRHTRIVHNHWVTIEIETIGPHTRDVPKEAFERIAEGQKIQVYPVDDTYVIPAFQGDNTDKMFQISKWVFLFLSSLPLLAGVIVFCYAIVNMIHLQRGST